MKKWHIRHRAEQLVYFRQYHALHRVERVKYERSKNESLRIIALDVLGGKCARCGLTDQRIFEIDHIVPLRRKSKTLLSLRETSGSRIHYRIVHGQEDTTGLQVLCPNCHAYKTIEDFR
jgi:5-methylcytosine-specific restriction endonuclease McrA